MGDDSKTRPSGKDGSVVAASERIRKRLSLGVMCLATAACQAAPTSGGNGGPVLGSGLEETTYAVGYSPVRIKAASGDSVAASLWYPALPGAGARAVTLGDYYVLGDSLQGRVRLVEAEAAARSQGVTRAALQLARDAAGLARLNAPPVTGSFPVVAVSPGEGGPPFHLAMLCEYLAGQGLMVVGVPSTVWMGSEATGVPALEAESDLLLEAAREVGELPNAAAGGFGVVGYSFGGSAATLAAMISDQVRAVAVIDPGFRVPGNYEVLGRSGRFDAAHLSQPLLVLLARGVRQEPDLDLLAAAPARSRILSFPHLRHGDFSSLIDELLLFSRGVRADRDLDQVAVGHDTAVRYVAAFLLAHLTDDEEQRQFLDVGPEENGVPQGTLRIESLTSGAREPGTAPR